MLYKLFSKTKPLHYEMQVKFMLFKFHCTNHFKSVYSDALFSIDTKLKPTLHNIGHAMMHTVVKKLSKNTWDKVINKHQDKPLDEILQDIIKSSSDKALKTEINNINIKDLPLAQAMLGWHKMEENNRLTNKILETDQTKLTPLFKEITYKRLVSLIISVQNEQAQKLVTHIPSEHLKKIYDLQINNLVLDKIVESTQSNVSFKLNEATYSIVDEFILPQLTDYNPLLGVSVYNLYDNSITEL